MSLFHLHNCNYIYLHWLLDVYSWVNAITSLNTSGFTNVCLFLCLTWNVNHNICFGRCESHFSQVDSSHCPFQHPGLPDIKCILVLVHFPQPGNARSLEVWEGGSRDNSPMLFIWTAVPILSSLSAIFITCILFSSYLLLSDPRQQGYTFDIVCDFQHV